MNRPDWDDIPATHGHPPDQARFEANVFAVLHDTVTSGRRIDLVAGERLSRHPWDRQDESIYPDLLICASDCLALVRAAEMDVQKAAAAILAAFAAWRGDRRDCPDDAARKTRIQVALGNVGRALKAALNPA